MRLVFALRRARRSRCCCTHQLVVLECNFDPTQEQTLALMYYRTRRIHVVSHRQYVVAAE